MQRNTILRRKTWLIAGLSVLSLTCAAIAQAQPTATVTRTRLIATTIDPIPGTSSFFQSPGFGGPFRPPVLTSGFIVAFVGNASTLEDGGLFYRATAGLQSAAAFGSSSPQPGVPFDEWDITSALHADLEDVAFSGDRSETVCDGMGGCSSSLVERGIFVFDGFQADLEIAGTPAVTPEVKGFDDQQLLYESGGQAFIDSLLVIDFTELADGFTISPPSGENYGFNAGVALAVKTFATAPGFFGEGIWSRPTGGGWSTIVTEGAAVPDFPGATFSAFGVPAVGSSGAAGPGGPPPFNVVVFRGEADFDRQGIYRSGGGSSLDTIADTNDSVDIFGSLEPLFAFDDEVAVDGLDIAFTARNSRVLVVFDAGSSTLRTVLAQGSTLRFGRKDYTVASFDLGPNSFDNGNIVLRGSLLDDSEPFSLPFEAVFIVDADGNGIGGPGSSQDDPIKPDGVSVDPTSGDPVFHFDAAPSNSWIDPPVASGFTYTMTGSSKFTAILDFPTGYDAPFEVTTGATSLGTFAPGDVVDFGPAGVDAFTVSGISPAIDVGASPGFSIQIETDTLYSDYTIVPVPEPSAALSWVAGAGLLAALARRRSRRG